MSRGDLRGPQQVLGVLVDLIRFRLISLGFDKSCQVLMVRCNIKYTIMCLRTCIGRCRQVSESLGGPQRVLAGLGGSRPVSAGLILFWQVLVGFGGS